MRFGLFGLRCWLVLVLAHECLDSVLLLVVRSHKNDGLAEVFLQIEMNAVIWDTGMRYYLRAVNTLAARTRAHSG